MSVDDLDLAPIREFLREFEARAVHIDLPSPTADELAAEIATLKAQVSSPKPKLHIIQESLTSTRTILEIAWGNAGAAGLLDLLKLIHL